MNKKKKLGLSDRIGTIEKGKYGNKIIARVADKINGWLFSPRTITVDIVSMVNRR